MKLADIRIRDPFIIMENGKYYLMGSTGDDPWERGSDFSLYVSDDLVNFEFVKTLVEDSVFSGYTQFWAPELHKYNGKFYIIVSVYCPEKGRGSVILISDKIDGTYKFLTGEYITPEGWTCLDATLFVYKDKPYLCFSNEWVHTITGDGDGSLFMVELEKDLTKPVGYPRKIVSGKYSGISIEMVTPDKKGTGWVAEGPYLLMENGKIALYWSTYTDKGYCILKNVADDIFGKYEFDKYVYLNDGGHSMVFTGYDGVQNIIFHQPNITPNERAVIYNLSKLEK